MTISGTQPSAGPTTLTERALGPDLARGVMLLFIAVANSHYFLLGDNGYFGGFPLGGSALDGGVAWTISTFVDGRSFPLFGFLFGYGVAHIVRRQQERGSSPKEVRRLLRRRAYVLIGVGFLHAVLLYAGDVLAAYGVLLLVGCWAVRWRDRWLLIVAAVFVLLALAPGDMSLAVTRDGPDPATALPTDLGAMVTERAVVSVYIAVIAPLGFLGPYLVGLWAGRRRILERPRDHIGLLRAVAAVGVGVAVLGAQPVALVHLGVLPIADPDTLNRLGPLHDATGTLGGIGYAALIALAAMHTQRSTARSGRTPGRIVRALQACGQRSMTCYLAQSVVWTLAFTPALLGLADDLSVAGTALLAAATWASTVVLADWMARTGRRGPFESLVRRATYRTPSR